jgi:hypothetical protein
MRVTENLKLRAQPDWRSTDLLAPWTPNDYIPAGTVFEWADKNKVGNVREQQMDTFGVKLTSRPAIPS